MVQKQQARTTPAVVGATPETLREATPERPRSSPWLIGALVGVTLALVTLSGWTVYQRVMPSPSERIAQTTASAWDGAKASAFTDVYARNALIVGTDGRRLSGIQQIVDAAKADRPAFAMSSVGQIAGTAEGSLVMLSYAPGGSGQVTGVALLEVENGKIIRQWNFGPATAPAAK
jgi:hypothetical protein